MLAALLIFLLAADATWSLECITNCSLKAVPFGEDLRIRTNACQQRVTLLACTFDITLDFETKQYSVFLGGPPGESEAISMSSFLPLHYDVSRQCSTDTDCVIRDAQNKIDEVTRRPYDATALYEEIETIITSPLAEDPITCFDDAGSVATCEFGQICTIDYDAIAQRIRSRGCLFRFPEVYVYDSPTDASFDVHCNSDLCNTLETYEKIKGILNKNNLVDANGRINVTGAKDDC